ncbi:MAG: hypothetical protein GDA50_00810 [Alphaproteobacteria bacterium GM202ARS2]|nr:hypothetical protein [Alphaproteobacteria bacterium GM202ARS2]
MRYFVRYFVMLAGVTLGLMATPVLAGGGHDNHGHGGHDHGGGHGGHDDHGHGGGHGGHGDEAVFIHGHFNGHFDGVTAAPHEEDRIVDFYLHGHVDWGARLWEKNKHRLSIDGEIFLDGAAQGHDHAHGGGNDHEEEEHHEDGDEDGDEHGHEDEDEHGEERARNSFFQDHPVSLAALRLTYSYDDTYAVYVGKFTPTVGFSPDRFVGATGYVPVHEYEIRERIGVGGKLSFDGARNLGNHDIEASAFFADTTLFSESLFYRRGHRSLNDGGPANTEDLSSFALSLGGENVFGKLGYRLGYSKQAKAEKDADAEDEDSVSLSLDYGHRFSRATRGHIVFEYAGIDSLDGEANNDHKFTTIALQLYDKRWLYAVQYTHVNRQSGNNEGSFRMSAGYRVGKQVRLHLGYQQIRNDENEISKRIGGTLEYTFDYER